MWILKNCLIVHSYICTLGKYPFLFINKQLSCEECLFFTRTHTSCTPFAMQKYVLPLDSVLGVFIKQMNFCFVVIWFSCFIISE